MARGSQVCALSIVEEHRRRNQTTRDRWETMTPHRERVMRLIGEARRGAGGSLCVLGAGNANDIDLVSLAGEFERIALVDLDEQSLERAVERVPEADRGRIELLGAIDLTGILPSLTKWQSGHAPTAAEVSAAIETARSVPPPTVGTFDVVASTCVLTQLIDSIYMGLAADQPQRQELVLAVRNRHLEILVELATPGGAEVLITDFVATETAPELAHLNDAQVPAAAEEWINQRNFFTGANPYAIRDYLLGPLAEKVSSDDVQVSPARRWDIGAKQLAVIAVTFRRRE